LESAGKLEGKKKGGKVLGGLGGGEKKFGGKKGVNSGGWKKKGGKRLNIAIHRAGKGRNATR